MLLAPWIKRIEKKIAAHETAEVTAAATEEAVRKYLGRV